MRSTVSWLVLATLGSTSYKDGVLKSVWDEEQRIKHIEEMEQKCIQLHTGY